MLRIGYFGDGVWAQLAIKKILANPNFSIAFVVLRNDVPDEELRKIAKINNIPCFQVKNVNSKEFISCIEDFHVDINVSMSFDQILKTEIINLAPKKFINCHAGALPFYRGRNILNWALINGEERFGVTVHYVDEGIDTGDIILQRFEPIEKTDRYGDLLVKAQVLCSEVLYDALILIDEDRVSIKKQEKLHPVGFYCSGRTFGDEYIDWNWSSERIYNFIRGIADPAPGARTFLKGKEYIIDRAELIKHAPNYIDKVGNVVGKTSRGCIIKTGDSTILVTRVIDTESYEELDLSKMKIGNKFYTDLLRINLQGLDDMENKPVLILGAGGHAKVLLDILMEQDVKIIGILDNLRGKEARTGGG